MSPVSSAAVLPNTIDDLTDDLAVAPLDGRLAADARYDEEIDPLVRRDGRITAGSVSTGETGGSSLSTCVFRDEEDA
jgi:hypothetical protein